MAFDEGVAQRLREAMQDIPGISEKKMFGGIAFLVHGHMCAGVVKDELMVRVGPNLYEEALSRAHSRKMDFTGKPMKGFVYIGTQGFDSDSDLQGWVNFAYSFVKTLPPKN